MSTAIFALPRERGHQAPRRTRHSNGSHGGGVAVFLEARQECEEPAHAVTLSGAPEKPRRVERPRP